MSFWTERASPIEARSATTDPKVFQSMTRPNHLRTTHVSLFACGLLAIIPATMGCAGDGKGGGEDETESGDGTVTDEWSGFCTGTFTEDTPIEDVFGDVSFTARSGDEYLLAAFDDSFGGRAEFLYLTQVGPDTFEVEPSADGSWPFSSDCAFGEGVPYYAVFDDVRVYAEEDLVTEICHLRAGASLPAGTSGRGFSYVGSSGSAAIYNVILGPFAAECGDSNDGYVRVPQTQSFGSTTWLVPIATVIGPE